MKVLVVLVLTAFSACSADVLWQEPPSRQLDVVKDAFWDYVAKATLTAEDLLKSIRESELGQDVKAGISESVDAVNQYAVALRTHLAPLTQDLLTKLSHEAELLKARLEKDLSTVSAHVHPYAEELRADLQRQVEELRRDVAPYTEAMEPEALRATLLQKSRELQGSLDKTVKELQAQMVPYTEELKQKMDQSLEEFQRNFLPLTQNFHTQLVQRAQEIQQNLAAYGELKTGLDVNTQELQAQLAAVWESFTKKTL